MGGLMGRWMDAWIAWMDGWIGWMDGWMDCWYRIYAFFKICLI
jgi:hypothetical protein